MAAVMFRGFDVGKLIAEYDEGRSLREIASEVGVSHVHLSRVLRANGAVMRARSSAKNTKTANDLRAKRFTIQAAHAVILYSYGVDVEEIAVSLGRTPDWVTQEVVSAGVSIRK